MLDGEKSALNFEGLIKIIDLGYARSTQECPHGVTGKRGTTRYMAPEIYGVTAYSGEKADIFALGVCLFVIVKGVYPFKTADPKENDSRFKLLKEGKYDDFWRSYPGLSNDLMFLITWMILPKPKNRATLA